MNAVISSGPINLRNAELQPVVHVCMLSMCVFSPWRIVDDCGGAFTMGAIGGGIFQSVKGFRNAPVVSFRN